MTIKEHESLSWTIILDDENPEAILAHEKLTPNAFPNPRPPPPSLTPLDKLRQVLDNVSPETQTAKLPEARRVSDSQNPQVILAH